MMNWILYVEQALRWICIILFTVLVTIVSLQVISRLLTGKSFTVVEELSMFLLAWSTFMCAAYAARKKHMSALNILPINIFRKKEETSWQLC